MTIECLEQPAVATKYCKGCNTSHPISGFGRWSRGKDGLQPKCKTCIRAYFRKKFEDPVFRERERKRATDRYHNHPEGIKAHLKQRYGLTMEGYRELLAKQHGLCAICERPPRGMKKRLAVDHDHKTGKVRGLLCCTCNAAIGYFAEDPKNFLAAIEYLSRST